MRRAIVAAAVVALLLAATAGGNVASAAKKPTTTTGPTTTTAPPTPGLGVPHVVSQNIPGAIEATVSCPQGEVALSATIAPADFAQEGDYFAPYWRPVVTDGVPTGYEFRRGSSGFNGTVYLTCAPVT